MLKWGFCCSVTKSYPLCVTPWTAIHQSPLSSTICQSLHKFMSIESVMLSNHLSATLLLLLPSESFPMCQFFAICDQGIEALVSASVLPMSIQDWFPLGLTGLISLLTKELSRVFSSTTIRKQFFNAQPLYGPVLMRLRLKNALLDLIRTMPKALTAWITINCGKFWKRWAYQTAWPASWETYMQVRKQQLELDMEQQTGSK